MILCEGSINSYSIPSPNPAYTYDWTIPSNASILNNLGDLIDVDWTGSTGGQICVTASQNGFVSEVICETITIIPNEIEVVLNSISGSTELCSTSLELEATITNVGDPILWMDGF